MATAPPLASINNGLNSVGQCCHPIPMSAARLNQPIPEIIGRLVHALDWHIPMPPKPTSGKRSIIYVFVEQYCLYVHQMPLTFW